MKKHLTILFLLFVSIGFAQERRLALVVGNSEYVGKGSYLENPVNDANDVSAKLKALGFEVTTIPNASYLEMEDAIEALGAKAKDYDVALFYYSGHGLQTNGENYLVPVDAILTTAASIRARCTSVNYLLDLLDESGCPLKIVCLDACRNNPFERNKGFSKGLSGIDASEGSLISFATARGKTADDGNGHNSPYTTAFLNALDQPNLKILDFFNAIATQVKSLTQNTQMPWANFSSLNGDFCFNKKATQVPSVVQATTPTPPPQPTPQKSNTTQPQPETVSTPVNAKSHEYVDLGLPSGTLWAICNVGANKPEDYGNYYAWGETSTKSTYDWATYKYANSGLDKLTKYCNISSYGNNGFTDNLTTLQSGDDPATATWGSMWRTPTKAQWDELLSNTTSQWTTKNGVKGRLFTSKKNGQTIFLPAAGMHRDSEFHGDGSCGNYWSRSLSDFPSNAWYFNFFSDKCDMYYRTFRIYGYSVRPVQEK